MARGRFITFEGGEGTGKSTQARRLAASLTAAGHEVLLTREPGGSPFAEAVRSLILAPSTPPHAALAEALMFYAARADHLDKSIRPALNRGGWVICDRYSDSTRVYQGTVGGLETDAINALERLVVGATVPDLTILLDLDPVIGLARADQRRAGASGPDGPGSDADRYEARNLGYHEALRAAFLAIANAEPHRCIVVDAFRSADAIAADIEGLVTARLGERGR